MTKEGDDLSEYIGGVGGWLLLFCISLVAVPFRNISKFYSGYESVGLVDGIPGLRNFLILHGISVFGLAIFSIYAGFSLWRIRPNAVKIAKIYLFTYLACSFLALSFPFIVGFPPDLREGIYKENLVGLFRSLVGFSIWFIYLTKSKRVKGTYGL